MRWAVCILCCNIFVWTVLAVEPDHLIRTENNDCSTKESCHECIRTPQCAWCKQLNFVDKDGTPKERCNTLDRLIQAQCDEKQMISPDNSKKVEEDIALSIFRSANASSSRTVQIKPQHVKLKLRVGEEYSLRVDYAQAEDYPVDLYYLMDLSKSMEDDKEKLAKLGNAIARRMRTLTSNFKLGFGSFVDKVVMPYVNTVPEKLETPCDRCAAPYGFQNHMPLSAKSEEFETSVRDAQVSGNLDGPEGGFDAVMQAMACEDQIRWRKKSHHLLVFSTDASFHYAGDGKLGGIVTPNDGECHMRDGKYTHSELLDYPSVSMINKKAIFTKTRIIFAVTQDQEQIYQQLTESIRGASLGILKGDSSNVVDLIEAEYKAIRSSVELQYSGASEHVSVDFFSNCLNKNAPRNKTNKCGGLKQKQDVTFMTKIKVNRAPEDRRLWKQKIVVEPVGVNEQLLIDLEIVGDCDCEREGNEGFVLNAKECHAAGSMQCGICVCDESTFGRFCECSKNSTQLIEEDVDVCKMNGTDTVCSGRGKCECGTCHCNYLDDQGNRYRGKYCQCDDFSCERRNGSLCSGEDHGFCDCGVCICKDEWQGEACECPTDDKKCTNEGDTEPCSGHGTCVCGKCVCDKNEEGAYHGDFGAYHGNFCEQEPTIFGRCNFIKPCVQCKVFESGPLTEEECRNQTICPYLIIEEFEVKEMEGEERCTFTDDDDCRFMFVYGLGELNDTDTDDPEKVLRVRVENTKECPLAINILAIVAGVIVAIVALGLAILCIWKIFTTIHDRREYAKFEKEKMMAKWDTGENPIYKQATSTFKNPTYGGKG